MIGLNLRKISRSKAVVFSIIDFGGALDLRAFSLGETLTLLNLSLDRNFGDLGPAPLTFPASGPSVLCRETKPESKGCLPETFDSLVSCFPKLGIEAVFLERFSKAASINGGREVIVLTSES